MRARHVATALTAILALVSGAGAAALARRGPTTTAASTPVRVGVLSPRRAPAVLAGFIADTRLATRLRGFDDAATPEHCLLVEAGGRAVARQRVDAGLVPASTVKLVTAVGFLGAVAHVDGRFTTTIYGDKPDAGGTVTGDVTLVGGGDPLIATVPYLAAQRHPPNPPTDPDEFARALAKAGVRHVAGNLLVDDGRYDVERLVPTWSPAYTRDGDVGPIGALIVNDGFSAFRPRTVAATDPAVAAGDLVRASLVASGIAVDGSVQRAAAPRSRNVLASVSSASYVDVVGEMLRESDNNTAENLLKETAVAQGLTPGTRQAGLEERAKIMRQLGLRDADVQAVDGSGLDRSDRATCAVLLAALSVAPHGVDLGALLPVAGRTGTLLDRFAGSPLTGRLHAKTGSLEGVTGLIGVVDESLPFSLRFAFVANGAFSDAAGRGMQNRLVALLATYPEAPAASDLAP